MQRSQYRYSRRGSSHGVRIVSQCIMYIDDSIEEGISRAEAISSCSKHFKISKSNIWRWWKVFDMYGENHIVLNEKMKSI